MPKKLMAAQKPPVFARMFPLDKLSVIQVQFFDNRTKADGKRGQSDYALKLFAWHRLNDITLMADADWWRVIQLIEPAVVLRWCRAKHGEGGMSDEQLAAYEAVAGGAVAMIESGAFSLVRMGHVASPPGRQYCVGQFVLVTQEADDQPVRAYLFIDGQTKALEAFGPTRSRGAYRKAGAAVWAMIDDPNGLIGQSRREAEKSEFRPKVEAGLGKIGGMPWE